MKKIFYLLFTSITLLAVTTFQSYAQIELVKDIYPGFQQSQIKLILDWNGTLFFNANDGVNGQELWKSDGTAAGTVLVKDINPGSFGSSPSLLTLVNGTLFFSAIDAANGTELWKSDGTAAGTVLVKDIYPGNFPSRSDPQELINVNGTLFFTAEEGGPNGRELWKSDGTAGGTMLVKNIFPGYSDPGASSLRDANGTLFFNGYNNAVSGKELWKSDGTDGGTVLVKDINPGTASSSPSAFIYMNGISLFSAGEGVNGVELWKSDGTDAGTVLVKDISPGSTGSSPGHFTNINGTLFFSVSNASFKRDLWKSDGTDAGTVLVKDMKTDLGTVCNVNGTLFFSASDAVNGTELWKSDGTEAGTVVVKDIRTGNLSSSPSHFININGVLYFTSDDGVHGIELWKSDGTDAGTVLVEDFTPGSGASFDVYTKMIFTGDYLYMSCGVSATGAELYKLKIDPPADTWYVDADHDGYGSAKDAPVTQSTRPSPDYFTSAELFGATNTDCEDDPAKNGANIYPGAKEITGNGIDENCDGVDAESPKGVVLNVIINTNAGKLVQLPFKDVIVEAKENNSVIEKDTTQADGTFEFKNLDPAKFYTLHFYFQDQEGLDKNILIDYQYTGFKPGDTLPDILLPYKMLLQTKDVLTKMRTKPNYEIKFILEFLDLGKELNIARDIYNVDNIESLLNDWKFIDGHNNQNKDIIDNLGRVYIAMYASDLIADDAYRLSKIMPKALSEFVVGILDFIPVGDNIKNVLGKGKTLSVGDAVKKGTEIKVTDAQISFALKSASTSLKLIVKPVKDPELKNTVNKFIALLDMAEMLIKNRNIEDGGLALDLFKKTAKDLINGGLFVTLYKYYIDKTQLYFNTVYTDAKILAPPDETFELAAQKVMVPNGTSKVEIAGKEADNAISLTDAIFASAEWEKVVIAAEKITIASEKLKPYKERVMAVADLTRISFWLDVIKETGYLTAFVIGADAVYANSQYQGAANILAFHPQLNFFNFGIVGDNGSGQPPSGASGILTNLAIEYNNKLDLLMGLIQNQQSDAAFLKTGELLQIDSALNKWIEIETFKFYAAAGNVVSSVPGYDSSYRSFCVQYNNNMINRLQTSVSLLAWYYDTTRVSFLDTLANSVTDTKLSNLLLADMADSLSSHLDGVPVPPSVVITGIEGVNQTEVSKTNPIKISYKNFGTDTAKQVFIKLETGGGFVLSADSIFVGNISPGDSGEITFQITAPAIDTFCSYTIALALANGEGDYENNHLMSHYREVCNGLDDNYDYQIDEGVTLRFFKDADGDGFGDIDSLTFACSAPVGYVSDSTDCTDADNKINPGGIEVPGNGIDENCDGSDFMTGIIANQSSGSITLFPNPVSDILFVSYQVPAGQELKIDITNAIGQRIYTSVFENATGNFTKEINLAGAPNGIYFVKLVSNYEEPTTIKFVKE